VTARGSLPPAAKREAVSDTQTLRFGLREAVPPDAPAAWGARLIYPDDVVWDRTDAVGSGSMSAHTHDVIFATGAMVLLLAMLPAVWRKTVMPPSTCVITGVVMLVFVVNYATMAYWYATAMEAGDLACWSYLLWLAGRSKLGAYEQDVNAGNRDQGGR
jgi:hypothetical protein